MAMIIKSVLEFAAVVLVIVGFVYEEKIAAFENKFIRACIIHARNYRKRKAYEAKLANREAQPRAKADDPCEAVEVTVFSKNRAADRVA